jgi:hypothetical protein
MTNTPKLTDLLSTVENKQSSVSYVPTYDGMSKPEGIGGTNISTASVSSPKSLVGLSITEPTVSAKGTGITQSKIPAKENITPENVGGSGNDNDYEDIDSNKYPAVDNTDRDVQVDDKEREGIRLSMLQPPSEPVTYRTLNGHVDSVQKDDSERRFNSEDDDAGFFNYFLTFVAICGIGWLIFHNKKRIMAMVVEGRRPRSARRRSSGSYRKLENNFD